MRVRLNLLRFFLFCLMGVSACNVHAISFALDSIAEWGKFPRFCINTYRWGDHFFNGYDTLFVKGAGYKFNIKVRSDNWIDYYNFDLPNNMRMRMLSDPSTSAGVWLTYMAVSVGYDKNYSKFFGNNNKAKEQFTFGFSCSLFSVNLYYINNDGATTISKFGPRGNTFNPDINFDGAHVQTAGLDLFYFFNHKKYSQAAAFNFSRIQTKSEGSFFAGFSYARHNFNFDFSGLPEYMRNALPTTWENYLYHVKTKNYSTKLGYGYNWVFAPKWLLAVSESPSFGFKKGFINADTEKTSFALSNQFKLSVVWNHKRWFAGMLALVDTDLIYDKESTFANASLSLNFSLGYRFNIW